MRNFCSAKVSHSFLAKNGSIYVYDTFKVLKLVNDIVSFENWALVIKVYCFTSSMSSILPRASSFETSYLLPCMIKPFQKEGLLLKNLLMKLPLILEMC